MKVTPHFGQYIRLQQSQPLQLRASIVVELSDATGILVPCLKVQLLCLLTGTGKEIHRILGDRRGPVLVYQQHIYCELVHTVSYLGDKTVDSKNQHRPPASQRTDTFEDLVSVALNSPAGGIRCNSTVEMFAADLGSGPLEKPTARCL
jgi:hypothetical protein